MESSFYKTYFEVEKNNWWMRVRRLMIEDQLKKYLGPLNKAMPYKILDFGCGSGFFVAQLNQKGYQSYGLDMSREAIAYGQSQGFKNLAVAINKRLEFDNNFFNAILMMDVLEHLEDESWLVREAERVLAPGGIALITVPAFQFLWGVQDEVSHHFRRYRAEEIALALQKNSNMRLLRSSYFNSFLFTPIALVRLVSKWLNLKSRQSDFDINSRLLNKTFFTIFNLERQALKFINFPVGVSILAVMKKESLGH